MIRIKALVAFGLLAITLLVINACCDEGYFYNWNNIILQSYSNGELEDHNPIKQNEFSLRVHLLSLKSEEAGIYIPNLIDYAYANDCMGKYLNIDAVSDVDILLLTNENNISDLDVVTYQFEATLNINSQEKIELIDLPTRLNDENSQPVEYFDLMLKEPFEKDVLGKFIVAVNLADKRSLIDTTETVKIEL